MFAMAEGRRKKEEGRRKNALRHFGPMLFGPMLFGPMLFGPMLFGPMLFGPMLFGPMPVSEALEEDHTSCYGERLCEFKTHILHHFQEQARCEESVFLKKLDISR